MSYGMQGGIFRPAWCQPHLAWGCIPLSGGRAQTLEIRGLAQMDIASLGLGLRFLYVISQDRETT